MSDEDKVITQPQSVIYCPKCSFPLGYCKYSTVYDQCLPWLKENNYYQEEEGNEEDLQQEEGNKATEGKKTLKNKLIATKETSTLEPCIILGSTRRSKRKYITTIKGIDTIESIGSLKAFTKLCAKKFACSSSVQDGEIILQGDILWDIAEWLTEEKNVDKNYIYELKKGIRKKFFR